MFKYLALLVGGVLNIHPSSSRVTFITVIGCMWHFTGQVFFYHDIMLPCFQISLIPTVRFPPPAVSAVQISPADSCKSLMCQQSPVCSNTSQNLALTWERAHYSGPVVGYHTCPPHDYPSLSVTSATTEIISSSKEKSCRRQLARSVLLSPCGRVSIRGTMPLPAPRLD